MRNFFTTFILVIFLSISAFSQSKTLVKNIATTSTELVVNVPEASIKTTTWDKNEILVILTVNLDNESLLNSLMKSTRYNIVLTESENKSLLTIPNLAKQISINGKTIKENVTIELKIPSDVTFKMIGYNQLVR